MTKTETLHFTYESPENLCKLLCTIHFEKTCKDKVLNYLWHDFFGRNKSDETVYRLMTELWPQGCTMNVDEIEQLTERMKAFLLEDDELIKKRVEYEKTMYPLYVFSKWNNKVVQCGFAEHVDKIAELCAEFFGKSIEDVPDDAISSFINSNFEIKSDCSTTSSIAQDVDIMRMNIYAKVRGR